MSFEHTFLELSSDTPLVIVDERLYHLSNSDSDGENYFFVGDQRISLTPGPSIAEIESFERAKNANDILEYQQRWLMENVDSHLMSSEEASKSKALTQASEFIMQEAMPLMIDTARELGSVLGIDVTNEKTGKELIAEVLAEENAKLIEETRAKLEDIDGIREKLEGLVSEKVNPMFFIKGKTKYESQLGSVIGNAGVYVSNGFVYKLKHADNRPNVGIHFDGSDFSISRNRRMRELKLSYIRALKGAYQRESIGSLEEQLETARQDLETKAAVSSFSTKTSFEYERVGWIREGNKFYVYFRVPKFAMRNPINTDKYHPFPETRVAVPVESDGFGVYFNSPKIIDPMVHPFLRQWDNAYEKICILSPREGKKTAEGLVDTLSWAVNTFINGLTIRSIKRHESYGHTGMQSLFFGAPLSASLGEVGSLTREDAEKNDYTITNEWHILEGAL